MPKGQWRFSLWVRYRGLRGVVTDLVVTVPGYAVVASVAVAVHV